MKHLSSISNTDARGGTVREAVRGFDGSKLLAARRAAGLTQEELAALIGSAQSAINRWERSAAAPLARYFGRLVDVLDISPTALLTVHRTDAHLRDLRMWAGLSQSQVRVDARLRDIGPIERGVKPVPSERVTQLAELYGVTEDEILAASSRDRIAWRERLDARRRHRSIGDSCHKLS